VPGHNDEDEWYWLGRLKDGRFFGAIGGCDFTGWDCQSGLISFLSLLPDKCLDLMEASHKEAGHLSKMANLRKQFNGEQPFGLEVVS
jgi:hypothetical protein